MTDINHPFYCVGCGNIQPDKESFDEHYRKCWLEHDDFSEEEIFNLIYNEKNY
jgi:hypothetical protein